MSNPHLTGARTGEFKACAAMVADLKGLKMRLVAIIAATVGSLALAGLATDVSAQSRSTPSVSLSSTSTASSNSTAQPPAQRRGLRWNDSGRWGLNLNLKEPVGRESDWGDVEAGAYYRLSPRLRVGAAANLSTPEVDPARAPETDRRVQPRVRLETIFKF